MADELATAYGRGLVQIARAEGVADRVADELFAFARGLDGNPQLRETLTDPGVPLEARMQAVGDLLQRAHPQTVASVLMLLQSGRIRQVAEVAQAAVAEAAEARGAAVAEVRTAKPLSEAQQQQLASALAQRVGRTVELKVVQDPALVGGIAVRLGDTVIDGSLAKRLDDIKGRLTGA